VYDVLVGVGGVVAVMVIVETAGVARARWERKRSTRLVGGSWNCIFNVQE
jgi:hypothetical protein